MKRNFFQEFNDHNQSPKIILNQISNHNEQMGIIKKTRHNDVNSKASLITQLQELLKALADVSNSQLEQKGSEYKDPIMDQLLNLQKRALSYDYKQIQKLCMLAIGKRILNVQLKKKRQQFQKKQQKKSEIQQFFRQNRIKKFDYDSLVEQKLSQNTLIVRPYDSGKGFIGSGNDYENYQNALVQCDFINVVREVNKIFFDIFSGKKKDKKTKIFDTLFRILWIPISVFLILVFALPFYSFPSEQIILTILMSIIVLMLSFLTLTTYLNVPSTNNQMQQSIEDTNKYFQQLNAQNFNKGKQFRWLCPDNFMYLEVKFDYQLKESSKKSKSQNNK